MTCDLCSRIKLGIRGSITPISKHRDSEKCKGKVFKVSKLDSKNRNLVSEAIEDPKVCCIGSVGENPCGFWGQDNYFTQLTLFLKRQVFNCIQLSISLFWDAIQKAAEFSQIIPCINVPIHCPSFPTAVSGISSHHMAI